MKTVLSLLPWESTPQPSALLSRLVSDASGVLSLPLVPTYACLSAHKRGGLWIAQENIAYSYKVLGDEQNSILGTTSGPPGPAPVRVIDILL